MRVSCVDAQDDLDDDDVDAPDDLPQHWKEFHARANRQSGCICSDLSSRRAGYLLPVLSVAATGADTCER